MALGAVLLAAAVGAAWAAVQLDDPGLDPDHSAVATAGLFAAGFCLFSLFKLIRVALKKSTWLSATVWLILAFLALLVLDVVAFATRLGG
jgi:hypothetical protein